MPYSNRTLRLLAIHAEGICMLPQCDTSLFTESTTTAELLHIRELPPHPTRSDPSLTEKDRLALPNLLLLCPACHAKIESDAASFPISILQEMKSTHTSTDDSAPSKAAQDQAKLLQTKLGKASKAYQESLAKQRSLSQDSKQKYSHKMIGANPEMVGYIDYLMALAADYWKSAAKRSPGQLGNAIKMHFKIPPKRTRYHLATQHFVPLVTYITHELLANSPVGKAKTAQNQKLCKSFEAFQNSK